MDASQLFGRYMRHLLAQQPGCLRSSSARTAARSTKTRSLTKIPSKKPIRSFHSSIPYCQKDILNAEPRSEDRASGGGVNRHPRPSQNQASPQKQPPETSKAQEAARRWRKASQDASEKLDALLRRQQTASSESAAGGKTPAPGRTARPANSLPDISAMLDELTFGRNGGLPKEQPIVLRTKPTLGRQVDVELSRGMDVTRAFQVLETRCNKGGNSVKADERNQKTHVRRGQKRKIVRRMRWRALFKEGFLQECARVRKMIKQGW